jgi:hypothetical protein
MIENWKVCLQPAKGLNISTTPQKTVYTGTAVSTSYLNVHVAYQVYTNRTAHGLVHAAKVASHGEG